MTSEKTLIFDVDNTYKTDIIQVILNILMYNVLIVGLSLYKGGNQQFWRP
jgi:hypothetical protein